MSTLGNGVFIISAGGVTLNKLSLKSESSSALNVHNESIETYVMKTDEAPGIVQYRSEDTCNQLDTTGEYLMPHLEDSKFLVTIDFDQGVSNPKNATSNLHYKTELQEDSDMSENMFASDNTEPSPNDARTVEVNAADSEHSRANELKTHSEDGCLVPESRFPYRARWQRTVPMPKKIPPAVFKNQLTDTSDTTAPLVLLPHTKQLMEISIWNFNRSLTIPQRTVSDKLKQLFERNCITNEEENEFDTADLKLMPLGYKPEINLATVKRIFRKRKDPNFYVSKEQICNYESKEAEPEAVASLITDDNDGTIGYVHTMLDTAGEQDKCFLFDADMKGSEEIIVIRDGQETAESRVYTHRNIDVLLAAAANNNPASLVMCQQPGPMKHIVVDSTASIVTGQHIIFVPDCNS